MGDSHLHLHQALSLWVELFYIYVYQLMFIELSLLEVTQNQDTSASSKYFLTSIEEQ